MISRHKTDEWIKNDFVDVSIKEIDGDVDTHWHEFYEIELILDGEGIYCVDGVEYAIERGSLFFLNPSSYHNVRFFKKTKLINFMFTEGICDADFFLGFFDEELHWFINLREDTVRLFHALAEDMVTTESVKYMSAMMGCILGKLQSFCSITPTTSTRTGMQYAILLIQNHFREGIRLEDAAKAANYSTNYFGNKFKEYTGVSFKEYVADRQYTFAAKMLCYTKLSVTEICSRCGFRDYSNFMTRFKKRFGMTPLEYRDFQMKSKKDIREGGN